MRTRIVIVGGGFAGLSTAVHLSRHIQSKDELDIVLIDKQREHVYLPLIYEVASGGLSVKGMEKELKRGVAVPFNLDGRLTDHENIKFRQGIVEHVDIESNEVELESGAVIPFDYLVLAMGAVNATFGIKGADTHAISLTSLDNALMIRKRCMIMANECKKDIRDGINIVIAGGGPNGVEVAAEIATAMNRLERKGKVVCKRNITIVDAGPRLLGMLSKPGSWLVKRRMKKLGVSVVNGTCVNEVKKSGVVVAPNKKLKGLSPFVKETVIKSDLTIWAAGLASRPEWSEWGLPIDKRGYISVDPTLQVHGFDRVFIAGDAASIIGRRMQQRAPEAIEQGAVVAENLIRLVRGHDMLTSHKETKWPFAIPLGNSHAVGNIGFFTFFGIFGYAMRKAIDLKYFLSVLSLWHALRVWFMGGKTYLEND